MAASAPAVTVPAGGGPADGEPGPPGGAAAGIDGEDVPQKRKATSFKITNVFLSRPPSNDGDDSCEDGEELEDSRTEDLSDITDANSLNSLSSKLESLDFVNNPVIVNGGILQSSAQANGPSQQAASSAAKPPAGPAKQVQQPAKEAAGGAWKVQATEQRRPSLEKTWDLPPYAYSYAHPGFGFVTYEAVPGGGPPQPFSYVDQNTGFIPVAGTMAVVNDVVSGGVSEVPVSSPLVGPHDFRLRFKIVKVATTDPLKRGRWTCLDFNDKPAVKEKEEKVVVGEKAPPGPAKAASTSSGAAANPERGASRASGPRPEAPRVPGQAEPPAAAPAPGPGEGAAEGKGAPTEGPAPRLPSLPPEERRAPPAAGQPPGQLPPGYSLPPATATTATPSLSIALPAPAAALPSAVQSPGAPLGRAEFPQATLGQVVRMPDGQLAQVSLTPLSTTGAAGPAGAAPGPGTPAQFPGAQQPPPSGLKPLPSKQQQQAAPAQPQVMVNAAGQQFLVSKPAGGAEFLVGGQAGGQGPAPAPAPARGQAAGALQQPGKVVTQSQPGAQQQALPAAPGPQQMLQKQFSPSGGPGPAPSMQPSVTPSSSSSGPAAPASSAPAPAALSPAAAPAPRAAGPAPVPARGPATSLPAGPQTSVMGAGGGPAAPAPVSQPGTPGPAPSAVTTVKYTGSSAAALYPVYPAHSVYTVAGTMGDHLADGGLLERLEDIASRDEDSAGGELEHESASGAGQGSIDNRIEQAMDLVKSHLMSAVRSEVEELRDKIKSLEDTVQILSNENTVLRGAVPPDVLAQLTAPRSLLTLQGPAVLGSLPAPEPAQHPALQPPQH